MREADAFYATRIPETHDRRRARVARQAYAGLLWSKQFYHYAVDEWLDGDPAQPAPPDARRKGRNARMAPPLQRRRHLDAGQVGVPVVRGVGPRVSHGAARAHRPTFAKEQLILLLREWYMHPNGQIPAYEFAFGDVNPPVHAWAVWRVYKMTGAARRA